MVMVLYYYRREVKNTNTHPPLYNQRGGCQQQPVTKHDLPSCKTYTDWEDF
jgi:hypothetical protein